MVVPFRKKFVFAGQDGCPKQTVGMGSRSKVGFVSRRAHIISEQLLRNRSKRGKRGKGVSSSPLPLALACASFRTLWQGRTGLTMLATVLPMSSAHKQTEWEPELSCGS